MENNNNNNNDPNVYTFVTATRGRHICSLLLLIFGIILLLGLAIITFLFTSIVYGIIEFVLFTAAVVYDGYTTYRSSLVHTTTLDKSTGKGTIRSKGSMACACCGEKLQEFNMIDVLTVTPGGGRCFENGIYYYINLRTGLPITSPNLVDPIRVNEIFRFINEYKMSQGVQTGQYPPQQGQYPPPQGAYQYPPQQGGYAYPPQQGGYPYPPQQGGYPYPPQQGGYPYPPQQFPPQQGALPPQQGAPQGGTTTLARIAAADPSTSTLGSNDAEKNDQ